VSVQAGGSCGRGSRADLGGHGSYKHWAGANYGSRTAVGGYRWCWSFSLLTSNVSALESRTASVTICLGQRLDNRPDGKARPRSGDVAHSAQLSTSRHAQAGRSNHFLPDVIQKNSPTGRRATRERALESLSVWTRNAMQTHPRVRATVVDLRPHACFVSRCAVSYERRQRTLLRVSMGARPGGSDNSGSMS